MPRCVVLPPWATVAPWLFMPKIAVKDIALVFEGEFTDNSCLLIHSNRFVAALQFSWVQRFSRKWHSCASGKKVREENIYVMRRIVFTQDPVVLECKAQARRSINDLALLNTFLLFVPFLERDGDIRDFGPSLALFKLGGFGEKAPVRSLALGLRKHDSANVSPD